MNETINQPYICHIAVLKIHPACSGGSTEVNRACATKVTYVCRHENASFVDVREL